MLIFRNKTWSFALAVAGLMLCISACKLENIVDPNSPSLEGVLADASLGEIQNLVTGIEAGMREGLNQYYDGVSVVGREYYRLSGSDPRFTSDLLGKGAATLDNNTFYTTIPYGDRYTAVKNCNILIAAVTNSTADMTDAQRSAAKGFGRVVMAHQMLMVLGMQGENGIRVDVADPDRLGAFLNYDDALGAIHEMIETGISEMSGAPSFPFKLGGGFAGFDTPETFIKFSHGLVARVATYIGEYDHVVEHLDDSFMDASGNLNTGVYYNYSTVGGDLLNPMWYPADAVGEQRVVHPSFVADAEAGDLRLSKAKMRTSTAVNDGLSSDYDFWVYPTNTTAIPLMRNEELILLRAEALIQTGAGTDAIADLNTIRTLNGLGIYSGATDAASLTNELLKQRRYSLFGEGHRWIDMRRYARLSELPLDRDGDDVWASFPRPASEN